MQALILVRHTLWVGFSCLSIKPCCAPEDALGQLTWACVCPEGHEVLSHLSASWRHFHMPQGSWNATGHLCLHNWISPEVRHCTLCEGWEKVSWWVFLTENWGFIYSFVWYVPFLWAEFPTKAWLFSSRHARTLPEGKETFSNQFHSSSSSSSLHRWLPCSVVHYHHLRSLAFIME